jgi:hypothetical protein
MAEIRLGRFEIIHGRLPKMCMVCGTPGATERKTRFIWRTPWSLLLLLCGIVPYLVFSFSLAKRMTVFAPLCHDHRNHWRTRALLTNLGLIGLVAVGVGLIAATAGTDRQHAAGAEWLGLACVGSVVLFVLWLVMAAILQITAIRPIEITDNSLTLKGVSDEFVQALQELREQPKNADD